MDNVTVALLAANILIISIAFVFWSAKRYETAVFAVALSPWISAIFSSTVGDLDFDEFEAGIGAYIRISLLMLMGGIGLIKFLKSRSAASQLPVQFGLFAVFLSLALISTSYSIDQQYTFIRSVSFIGLFGFLIGLHSWLENRERLDLTLNTLFLMVALATAINLATLIIWPDRAWYDDRFRGLWDHPNTMGSFCMLAYPILFWKYRRCGLSRKWMVAALAIGIMFLHVLTGSRASLAAAMFGVCIWSLSLRNRIGLIGIPVLIAIAGLVVLQFRPAIFERDDASSFTDLNGRTEFWYGARTLIFERPVMGYGYAVEGKVWSDPRFYRPGYPLWAGSARTSLHNGYLSVTVGLGLVGFALWCALLLLPLWRLRLLPQSDYKALAMAVVLPCLLLNIFETEITGTATLFWIVWVICTKLCEDSGVYEAARSRPSSNPDFGLVPSS